MYRCPCGSNRCNTPVSKSTFYKHKLDQILNEHHNDDNFENNDPLPVEAAEPPVEDVEHSEQPPDPEVCLQIFPVKPLSFLLLVKNSLEFCSKFVGPTMFAIFFVCVH